MQAKDRASGTVVELRWRAVSEEAARSLIAPLEEALEGAGFSVTQWALAVPVDDRAAQRYDPLFPGGVPKDGEEGKQGRAG